jgi:hypothetical protein
LLGGGGSTYYRVHRSGLRRVGAEARSGEWLAVMLLEVAESRLRGKEDFDGGVGSSSEKVAEAGGFAHARA